MLNSRQSLKSEIHRGKEHSKEAKFLSFRKICEFLSDCEVPRGGGDIPTPL